MNKSGFIDAVALKAGLSKKDAGIAVNAVLEVIEDGIKKKESIVITGFGAFGIKRREARVGKNPQTKEPVQIAASNIPYFKAGKALKDAANES